MYDPVNDEWTQLADMSVALGGMKAACIDGYVYLVGGRTSSNEYTNYFLIYNTANDIWITSTWPKARTPMTAVWDGKLYAFGGYPGPEGRPARLLRRDRTTTPYEVNPGGRLRVHSLT